MLCNFKAGDGICFMSFHSKLENLCEVQAGKSRSWIVQAWLYKSPTKKERTVSGTHRRRPLLHRRRDSLCSPRRRRFSLLELLVIGVPGSAY